MKFREKILIYSSILIIAIVAIYIFLISPLRNSISRARNNWEDQKIIYEITKDRSENMASFKKDIEEINEKKENLDKFLISSNKQINFFRDLENTADTLNVDLTYDLEQIKKNNDEDLQTVNIDIKTTGQYNNILKYIASLESFNYYIKISNIKISSLNSNKIQADIQAKTYWQ